MIWPRLKSLVGGESNFTAKSVPAATTVYVPDDMAVVRLTGTATITTLNAANFARDRLVLFRQTREGGATTFTNTPGATTAGQMDLGALDPSNVVLTPTSWLGLWLRSDGVWERVFGPTLN